MIANLLDRDLTDVFVLVLAILGVIGLVLAFVRSVRAWRVQMAALLAFAALWAGVIVSALTSSAHGSDCGEAHHEGEWPVLIVTLAWSLVLLVAMLAPRPPFHYRAVRLASALANAALPGGTIAYLSHVQPTC
jgi:cbb3-type cytochrome oxidase subunit 1